MPISISKLSHMNKVPSISIITKNNAKYRPTDFLVLKTNKEPTKGQRIKNNNSHISYLYKNITNNIIPIPKDINKR